MVPHGPSSSASDWKSSDRDYSDMGIGMAIGLKSKIFVVLTFFNFNFCSLLSGKILRLHYVDMFGISNKNKRRWSVNLK